MQSVWFALAICEPELLGHVWHTLDTAPVDGKYVPRTHAEQRALPLTCLNFPGMHCVQVLPFSPLDPALQTQLVCLLLADDELECVGHSTHTLDMAATTVENVPAIHGEQGESPGFSLNVPATHWTQILPFAPLYPELQRQSDTPRLAAEELEFVGHDVHSSSTAPTLLEYFATTHSEHALLPFSLLYFPATHCVQGIPFCPVDPALQAQSVLLSLPIAECEFAGHGVHTSDMAPTAVEYVPSLHGRHGTFPR